MLTLLLAAPGTAFALPPGSFVEVASGGPHACGRLETGGVQCWGSNVSGQLGNNNFADSALPVNVVGIAVALQVTVGLAHTCARLVDGLGSGLLSCWGLNAGGRLGDGTTTQRLQPTVVAIGASNAASVDSGTSHTCATFADGTARCWGDGALGQLGAGALTGSLTPEAVIGVAGASGVSAGNGFSCVVLGGGSVKCWGSAAFGRLGNGVAGTEVRTASLVMPGTCTMDVDGDGLVPGSTDVLLLARAAMGLSGAAVTQSAVAAGAPRTDWADVRAYLATVCGMNGLAP